jgi:hypothetical protein
MSRTYSSVLKKSFLPEITVPLMKQIDAFPLHRPVQRSSASEDMIVRIKAALRRFIDSKKKVQEKPAEKPVEKPMVKPPTFAEQPIQVAQANSKMAAPSSRRPRRSVAPSSQPPLRFINSRSKAKLLVLRIDGLINPEDRDDVKQILISIKGVVSLYFEGPDSDRINVRVLPTVSPAQLGRALAATGSYTATLITKNSRGDGDENSEVSMISLAFDNF